MALALLYGLLREVDAQWQPAGSMDELVTLVESEEFASSIRGVWAVVHERGCRTLLTLPPMLISTLKFGA